MQNMRTRLQMLRDVKQGQWATMKPAVWVSANTRVLQAKCGERGADPLLSAKAAQRAHKRFHHTGGALVVQGRLPGAKPCQHVAHIISRLHAKSIIKG